MILRKILMMMMISDPTLLLLHTNTSSNPLKILDNHFFVKTLLTVCCYPQQMSSLVKLVCLRRMFWKRRCYWRCSEWGNTNKSELSQARNLLVTIWSLQNCHVLSNYSSIAITDTDHCLQSRNARYVVMKLSEQCYVAMIVVGKLATTRWEVARQRHDNKPSPA